jgi:hypothetical protein
MRRVYSIALLALTAFLGGCNSEGETAKIRMAVVPVSGKFVQADNRPLPDAWVVFHPKDPPANEATAATNPDGTFRLGTFSKEDGIIPGNYVVTIAPHPQAKGKTPRIPGKYASAKTSPIKIEITKDGPAELPPIQVK